MYVSGRECTHISRYVNVYSMSLALQRTSFIIFIIMFFEDGEEKQGDGRRELTGHNAGASICSSLISQYLLPLFLLQ
jgi:hypothetical protein